MFIGSVIVQANMNVDVTIIILCGNCSMTTKFPSESIDMCVSH